MIPFAARRLRRSPAWPSARLATPTIFPASPSHTDRTCSPNAQWPPAASIQPPLGRAGPGKLPPPASYRRAGRSKLFGSGPLSIPTGAALPVNMLNNAV